MMNERRTVAYVIPGGMSIESAIYNMIVLARQDDQVWVVAEHNGIEPRYLEEYDYKYNTRDMSDTARTEAAIRQMEGRRVTLYKRPSGEGDALIGHKSTEPGIQGTRRGQHLKRRK